MNQDRFNKHLDITEDMTILDIVSSYPGTETVFRRYDDHAGVCLCCQALFDPLKSIGNRYNLDMEQMIADLLAYIKAGDL